MPSTVNPTGSSVLKAAMSAALKGVWTAAPGVVLSYDKSTQKANIQIPVMSSYIDEDGERQVTPGPVLNEVPIQFPGAGAYRMTWPIEAGDIVVVLFFSVSTDRWLALGGSKIDPEDDRRNTLNDAVAIPGLHNFANIPTDAPDDALVMHADKIKLGASDASENPITGDGVVTAGGTDSFTGTTYGGLGNASTRVFAK